MNKINYSLLTEKILDGIKEGTKPKLLLHACCAPCSSACLEYLSNHFDITVLYYNPNISPEGEFQKRYAELKRLIEEMPEAQNVKTADIGYRHEDFIDIASGLENVPEGGERCFKCYRLRLEAAAKYAKENNFDYFCTTLTISPLKNSQKINEIGREVQEEYGVEWLPSDFKKKEGFKRSIELSKKYNLYRQNYCGCVYSRNNSQIGDMK